jgi:thiosulfate/3-mercaptopyruvate sulfurtransferase
VSTDGQPRVSDIELTELSARLGEVAIVDVRRDYEYDGSFGSPCDPRQGHIPGARNLALEEMMAMSESELRDRIGLPAGAELVAYCHSGSRSALAVTVLRGLGYDARNYPGSWHEWSRSEQRIEAGG